MPKESRSSAQVFYPRFTSAELVALLRERAPLLNAALPLERMWLFGSWAKRKATAFSDIDLLVVYADPPRADAYVLVRRLLRLRGLEPHVYSKSQADQIKGTLERMTRDSILLFPESTSDNLRKGICKSGFT